MLLCSQVEMILCSEHKNTELRHFPKHMLSYAKIGVLERQAAGCSYRLMLILILRPQAYARFMTK
jgi:hypothetical protein